MLWDLYVCMHLHVCVTERESEHYLWCAALCPGRRLKWQAHTATCSDTTNWELHLAVAVVWLCAWVCGCSCQHICRCWKRYARKGAGRYGKNSHREIFFPHIRINIHHNISQITHRLLFASKWRYWFNFDLNIYFFGKTWALWMYLRTFLLWDTTMSPKPWKPEEKMKTQMDFKTTHRF